MKPRFSKYIAKAVVLAAASCMISSVASAQRTTQLDSAQKDQPAPRLADGHPDFSGVWFTGIVPDVDHVSPRVPHRAYDPKVTPQEKPSFQPWALAKIKLMGQKLEELEPNLECSPRGALSYFLGSGYPIQFVHTPRELVLLTESDTTYRYIPTDGRPHTKDPDPQFNGDAVGHWEGDTLVVDVIGLDPHTWIGYPEYLGWFPSDAVHYTERYSRPNAHTFIYQATVEDSKVLTKPWTSVPRRFTWAPNKKLYERYCTNNQDYAQLTPDKKPVTAEGNDERFFDDQEYERLRKQYNR